MQMRLMRRAALAATFSLAAAAAIAGSFAVAVVEFHPGMGAGFGQGSYPGNVLGPPNGTTNPAQPNFAPEDLLSLGDGGWIVLDFGAHPIVDESGVDLAVFENPVQPLSQPTQSFADTAIVFVSNDATNWTVFPFNFIPPPEGGTLLEKANYVGLAGVNPTFSSPTNGISPFDPALSGGDFFDLSAIGFASARYVKIQDTGTTGATQTVDGGGDIVDDAGNHFAFGEAGSVGFDLDSVAAINSGGTAAAKEWALYE